MNFELVLTVVEKNTAALQKVATATKTLEAAAKSQGSAAIAITAKVTEAMTKEAKAADELAKAEAKAGQAIQSTARAAQEGTATITAHGAATAGTSSAFDKLAGAAERSMSAWRRASSAIKSVTGKMLSGMRWRQDGEAAASGFMSGFKQRLANSMPQVVTNSFHAAWTGITGQAFYTGQGSVRANINSLGMAGYGSLMGATQSQKSVSDRLRPDMGSDAAVKEVLNQANAFMVGSPFQRQDVREAAVAGAGIGLKPDSPMFKALGDAAAASGQTLTDAVNAYKMALDGNIAAMAQFGISSKDGEDGKTQLNYKAGGKDQSAEVKTGDKEATGAALQKALDARFGGGMDRARLSFNGLLTMVINQWQNFIDKVMDNGPWQFLEDRINKIIQYFAAGGDADTAAANLGKSIKNALEQGEKIALNFVGAVKAIYEAVNPVAEAFGGWSNALTILMGLAAGSWFASLLAPIITLTTALVPLVAGTWAFTAALLANPVTWIVAGVIALGVAAYELYAHWDTVSKGLQDAWEGMKTAASNAFEGIKNAVSEKWEAIKTATRNAVNGAVDAAAKGWDDLKTGAADKVKAAVDAAGQAWEKVQSLFSWDALAKVKEVFDPVINWVKTWGKALETAFRGSFEAVQNFLDGAWEKLGNGFKAIGKTYRDVKGWVTGDPLAEQAARQEELLANAGKAREALQLLETLRSKMGEVQSAVAAFNLLAPIQSSIGQVQAYLGSVSFFSHGAAMMQTLADGMKSKAAAAVEAVRSVTQQMRDYLPHSPAKVGPLSDLDQVRFSETLASAIRPGPALAAVQAMTQAMRGELNQPVGMSIGMMSPEAQARGMGGESGGRGGGAVNVNVSMPVNIPQGAQDAGSIIEALRRHSYELADMVKRELANQDRLNFKEA